VTATVAAVLLTLSAAPADPVVAEVNGEAITPPRFLARMALLRSQGNEASPEAALDGLVRDLLRAQEARRRALHREVAVAEAMEVGKRLFAGERLLERDLFGLEPAEEQLKELHHLSGDAVHVRLVSYDSRASAEAGLGRLASGTPFAEEAKRSLDQKTRAKGGDLGTRTRSDLDPAVAALAFEAPLHVRQGPVALSTGFAVFEVLERTRADEASYISRRDALRRFASEQIRKAAKEHLLEQLRRKHGAAVDEAFLQKTGTSLEARPGDAGHVLARVRGRTVTYGEVLEDARSLSRGQATSHFSGPRVKSELARARVDRLLLEAEAMDRGLAEDPEVVPRIWQYEQAVLAQAMEARIRAEVPVPSPGEVADHHREHAGDFAHPATRTCAHILLGSRGEAEAARRRIAAGEAFEELARGESLDRASAQRGGGLGEISDAQIDSALRGGGEAAFATALRDAVPGKLGEPVQSGLGFHLVRCGPRSVPQPRPLGEVREAVEARLREERARQAVERMDANLRAAARIRSDAVAARRLAGRS